MTKPQDEGTKRTEPDIESHRPEGTPKSDGVGSEGTVPGNPEGVAAGHTDTPSTFEPEEDRGTGS